MATACWTLPAQAQMVKAQDVQSIVRALEVGGYGAKVSKDSEGDPMITSTVSGSEFQIFFYNCQNHENCATVQFHSGYDMDGSTQLSLINTWNREQRFGRAYLDAENDPIIEMDIDLDDGGLSQQLFIDNVEFWDSVVALFEKQIGYKK